MKTPRTRPGDSHQSRGPESAERLNPNSEPLCPRNTGSGCGTLFPASDADHRCPRNSERAAGGCSRGSRPKEGVRLGHGRLCVPRGQTQAQRACPSARQPQAPRARAGACRPLRPAAVTGVAPWRTVRAHGPGLHSEHSTGLQGAGTEAGRKATLDAGWSPNRSLSAQRGNTQPQDPGNRPGGAGPQSRPLWIEAGPAQTPLVMQQKATRGQHVAPGTSSPGLGKLSKVIKTAAEAKQSPSSCVLGRHVGCLSPPPGCHISLGRRRAACTPSCESRRCPSKDT